MDNFPMFLCVFIPSILTLVSSEIYSDSRPKCEEISVPMCRGIGYNMTSMPNQFHHEKQDEAGMEAHQFWPLVEINCSDDLKFFLCSMYTPICMEDYTERLPACRSVCERAHAGCASIMSQYGFPWPDSMDCNNFPPYGSTSPLCMDGKDGKMPEPAHTNSAPPATPSLPTLSPPSSSSSPTPVSSTPSSTYTSSQPSSVTKTKIFNTSTKHPDSSGKCHCHCRPPLIKIHASSEFYNHITGEGVPNCVLPCHSNLFFSKHEQSQYSNMITLIAFLCSLGSLMVVFTYFTDPARFWWPERSIIFLSVSYLMVSLGFLFPKFFDNPSTIPCDGTRLLHSGIGTPSWNCYTVFLLIYFFSMAASSWWVILTFSWFLSTTLTWPPEIIDSIKWFFHLFAWGIPFILSYLAVTMGAIDGEPLAGICLVGNFNSQLLVNYIILPLSLYLVVGVVCFVAGLFSIRRIRESIAEYDKSRLKNVQFRISALSVAHIGVMIVVILCNSYQYMYESIWVTNYNCSCAPSRMETPYAIVHLLKYIMFLAPGITTCFWIMSFKTLESWWNCLTSKLCCCLGIGPPNPRGQLIGSTSGGSSQYIVNSQRSYKQINHIAQLSASGQPHRKISLSHV